MAHKEKEKKKSQKDICRENLENGIALLVKHPLFGHCLPHILPATKHELGTDTMSLVYADGTIKVNIDCLLSPQQWSYVIAHNILHLAFGHFDAEKMPGYTVTDRNGVSEKITEYNPALWNMACDIYITKFLADIKFGQSVHDKPNDFVGNSLNDEIKIYNALAERKVSPHQNSYGTAAVGFPDMRGLETPLRHDNLFARKFTFALAYSVSKTVSEVGGYTHRQPPNACSEGEAAAKWFVDHYPLLGGLAAHFRIIEDYGYCHRNDIHIAAVDVVAGEIYLNPANIYTSEEWKFILAHEYLHAGLQHHNRCNGRNAYLWNVACDFVINGWLTEMQIGTMPEDGILYDPDLAGLSAESVYDLLLDNIRKYEKANTLRGFGKGDIIGKNIYKETTNTSLDDFCKNALAQGLDYHQSTGRGMVPAALIEEIRSLAVPPIPWDVELAKWFDTYFTPLEKYRSYSRPSRRQAATPDIPRPRYCPRDIPVDSRTFGVVIDTSGSMSARMIGKALGAVASYSVAHEVPFARVVFCDAAAYDIGYVSPEDIAGRVAVKGRGGTVLQPGVDVLTTAKDFPKDGPILIITDGEIESRLDIKHEHAYLLPKGKRLPFRPKGQVFYFDC